MEVMRTAYAKRYSGQTRLKLNEANDHGRHTSIVKAKRALFTFQYFAESFDGVKGAFEMTLHNFLHNANSTLVPHVMWAQSRRRYEGTGRSLFLKLIQQLRQQSSAWDKSKLRSADASAPPLGRECYAPVALHESIRYGPGDHVEQWVNQLLCLDTASRAVPCLKNCHLYPSYWVFILGVLGHQGNTYLTSLPLVSVRHRGRVNSLKVDINFTSSGSSIFLVHNLCCDKYI